MAFLETVMVKSYESLVDSNTTVDVNTGMVAAARLQSLMDSKDDSIDIAEMRANVAKISEAVRAVVPESMWDEITEKLAEQHPATLDVGSDSFDDADDEPFDPTELIDEDDEF
jgi:hypothetical protein